MNYYKWDYDTNKVIQYERHGECNQCGDCCKANIKITLAGAGSGTNEQGIWSEAEDLGKRWFLQQTGCTPNTSRCSMLDEDNKCTEHNDKNTICDNWPTSPEHIIPFENCSYSFLETACWEIE